MTKNSEDLVLKIIFGFVLISSIDSILYLVANLISTAYFALEIPAKSLAIISIPVLTLGLYSFTIYRLIKIINHKGLTSENLFQNISRPILFSIFAIAIFLGPITNRLSGLISEHYFSAKSFYLSPEDYLNVYGWTTAGVGISRWSALILLTVIFLKNHTQKTFKN